MPTWLKSHPGSALITGCRHFVAILCSYFAMSKQCLQPAQRLRFRRAECSSPPPLSSRMSPVPTPTHSKRQHTKCTCLLRSSMHIRPRQRRTSSASVLHGWAAMWAVPWLFKRGHRKHNIAHLSLVQCIADHDSRPAMDRVLTPVVEYPESQIGALQSCAF